MKIISTITTGLAALVLVVGAAVFGAPQQVSALYDADVLCTVFDTNECAIDAVDIGGISGRIIFTIGGGHATLTAHDNFQGDLNIPSSIVFSDDSNTYEVTGIGNNVFLANTNLGDVTVPNTIEQIGESAFQGSSIGELTFQSGGTEELVILPQAFYNSWASGTIAFPSRLAEIQSDAFGNTAIDGITFENGGSSALTIGSTAFYGAVVLTGSVTFPANLSALGDNAFANTGITDVYFLGLDGAAISVTAAGAAEPTFESSVLIHYLCNAVNFLDFDGVGTGTWNGYAVVPIAACVTPDDSIKAPSSGVSAGGTTDQSTSSIVVTVVAALALAGAVLAGRKLVFKK
ncbi:MAG: leucine-rich repeat domain-containing protein [Candidatus Nomurabacteria bacterium]|nr:leucine-rich repeat domain-containing protein [Candidatus Nomurabacteria bacterium]